MAKTDELYAEAERLKDEGQLEEAVNKLEELLGEDPDHVLSHLALAVLYGRLKRHDDAIRHGQKACELDPKDAFNFTAMSVTFQRAGKIPEAEDAMAQARMMQGH